MRQRYILLVLIVASVSSVIFFWLMREQTHTHESLQTIASLSLDSFARTSGATPTPTAQASSSGSSFDPAIAAIIAAVVAGVFGVIGIAYGTRQQRKILRYQKELDAQDTTKRQEKERETATLEAVRREMLLAQNNDARAKAYRKALHADPRISRLQILDMSRPLEVTNVYVRVRVHEEARLRYDVDPLLSTAEQQRDPNALLQAGKTFLERRVSTALDPDEAIRKYQRCVIVGDPGAGKTTLLKFLALSAADKKLKSLPDLPIHIELNAFAANAEYHDLLDFASHIWDERYAFLKTDARAYMDKMMEAGKAILLLDALDETVIGEHAEVAETSYQRVSDAILQIATRYPLSPIVVTARKAGYQQRMSLTGFTELEVVDFRQEDIEQFVTRWFACYHEQQKEDTAADLNTRLRRSPRIQSLAANPLLLSLIVLVYQAQLDLPDRRADLYKRCVDVLLTEWDAKRNIRRRREFKSEHKKQLLAELAWHFHQEGRRYFPERELQAEIARFLPALGLPAEQYEQVLKEITNENGLLKEQARGWYGFLHLTLQEYFVAQYVNDRNELTTLLKHVGDPWWEEVLLLYAGQTADASLLLEHLLGKTGQEGVSDDIFHTNVITAGRCLAAYPTMREVSLRENVLTRLFDLLTTSPSYSLNYTHAAEALAEIGGQVVNSHLIQLLSNEQIDADVRGRIAAALGTLGERLVAPELLKLLSNEQLHWNVCGSIAAALGTLGERSVAPELLKLLSNEQLHWNVHGSIAAALGTLAQDEASVHALLALLQTTEIKDSIYTTLWHVSRHMGVRVVVRDIEGREQKVELLKW